MMLEICEIRVLRTEVGAGLLVPAESDDAADGWFDK
jgi:hypothetical protein